MEKLNEDFAFLLQLVGVSNIVPVSIPVKNDADYELF